MRKFVQPFVPAAFLLMAALIMFSSPVAAESLTVDVAPNLYTFDAMREAAEGAMMPTGPFAGRYSIQVAGSTSQGPVAGSESSLAEISTAVTISNAFPVVAAGQLAGLFTTLENVKSRKDIKEALSKRIIADAAEKLLVPAGEDLLQAEFVRQGPDLLLIGPDGARILVVDFFATADPPILITEAGARITPDLAAKLAGPMAPVQYAQAQSTAGAEPIGKVETILVEVSATRADGRKVVLEEGAPLFQGDVIESDATGAVAIVFVDGMTMSLGEGARMVLDEIFYNPTANEGSAAISLVQGALVFASGKIAALGDDVMTIETPTATIGIRGTLGAAIVDQLLNLLELALFRNPLTDELGRLACFNDSKIEMVLEEEKTSTKADSYDEACLVPASLGDDLGEFLARLGAAFTLHPVLSLILEPEAGPRPPGFIYVPPGQTSENPNQASPE